MKQKPLKFIVSSPYYESLFRRETDAIRDIVGEFEVVKTKPCLGGVNMKIWVLPKSHQWRLKNSGVKYGV